MALLQLKAPVDVTDNAPEHAGRPGMVKEISANGDKILVKLGKYGQRWPKTESAWFAREHLKVAVADVVYDRATFSEAELGPPPAKRPKVRLDAPHRPRCISSAVFRVPISALTPRLFFLAAGRMVRQEGDAPVRACLRGADAPPWREADAAALHWQFAENCQGGPLEREQ